MVDSSQSLLLTTSQVGDLLGVHPSTVKRWSGEGELESEKTSGGHRRIHLQNALATARDKEIQTFLDPFHPWEPNVWRAVSEAADEGTFRRLHSLALGWLSQGETDLLTRLFHAVGSHPALPFSLFLDHGVRDFMRMVGEEWEAGRLQVGEEHMATQVLMEVLIRLRGEWDPGLPRSEGTQDPRPVAVVGGMEGDNHELGALAVRVLLEKEGWKVYYLGGDVPMEEFSAIQQGQLASLVCVSLSPKNSLPDLQRAVRVLSEFYRPNYPYSLALGGSLEGVSGTDKLPEGPFDALSLSFSVTEFQRWVRTLPGAPDPETNQSRRVA